MGGSGFLPISEAIEQLRGGGFLVLVDGAGEHDEGDVTVAAEFATADAVNFMATHARGLVRLCLPAVRCDELGLVPMPQTKRSTPSFTVSIEAREGIATGISAADRSRTIHVAIDPSTRPEDLVRPGHVFPIRAADGGVLERPGRVEAAVDLARLAGLNPAGVVCQIMDEDGRMAKLAQLRSFCRRHGIGIATVRDLAEYRRRSERNLVRDIETALSTRYGEFTVLAFRERFTGRRHVALVKGDVAGRRDIPARVHHQCLAGDLFRSVGCNCGRRLDRSLRLIAAEGRGVLVYVLGDDPLGGIHSGGDTDGIAAAILAELGVRTVSDPPVAHPAEPAASRR